MGIAREMDLLRENERLQGLLRAAHLRHVAMQDEVVAWRRVVAGVARGLGGEARYHRADVVSLGAEDELQFGEELLPGGAGSGWVSVRYLRRGQVEARA